VLTAGHNPNAYLSGRNLQSVEVMAYPEASAYDILWSEAVVVEEGALTGVMPEPLPEETEAEKAERAEKRARTGKTGRPVKATPKKAPKAKPAAKAKAAKKITAKKSADKPAKRTSSKSEGKKPAPKHAPRGSEGKKGSK
jgi:hypothetical protein